MCRNYSRHDERAFLCMNKSKRHGKRITTPCFQTSSNIVVQTVKVNTAISVSKLQTENINKNIKNSSSDDPYDNKEIQYVKTTPNTSMQNRATKTKFADFMINHIEKENWLSHKVIDVSWSLLWEKRNTEGFEDTELVWNQFSQRRETDLGRILLIRETEHWIFVYWKGENEINICDSLRNSESFCNIASCMYSATKQ